MKLRDLPMGLRMEGSEGQFDAIMAEGGRPEEGVTYVLECVRSKFEHGHGHVNFMLRRVSATTIVDSGPSSLGAAPPPPVADGEIKRGPGRPRKVTLPLPPELQ